MKRLESLLQIVGMLLAFLLGIVLPAVVLVFGVGSMLLKDASTFVQLGVYAVALFAVVGAGAYLVKHPKIGPYAKFFFGAALVLAFVNHCVKQGGSGSDCTPSRYVDCDR